MPAMDLIFINHQRVPPWPINLKVFEFPMHCSRKTAHRVVALNVPLPRHIPSSKTFSYLRYAVQPSKPAKNTMWGCDRRQRFRRVIFESLSSLLREISTNNSWHSLRKYRSTQSNARQAPTAPSRQLSRGQRLATFVSSCASHTAASTPPAYCEQALRVAVL